MSYKERCSLFEVTADQIEAAIGSAENCFVLNNAEKEAGPQLSSAFKFSKLVGLGVKDSFEVDSEEVIPALKSWLTEANDFVFAYLSYDAKNLLETLDSRNPDSIGFPAMKFVIPETLIVYDDDTTQVLSHNTKWVDIEKPDVKRKVGSALIRQGKEEYMDHVQALKQHIQAGDIYEVNYCLEHGFMDTVVEPYQLFNELANVSPAPFSCYVADNGRFLLSSSPERFMNKTGSQIVSQPMKGTNRKTDQNDRQKELLFNDPKERSENVMITDLVRNDLSKSAKQGSVVVEELCGVYEFAQVNQMISTVSAIKAEEVHPLDVILNAFPMGSMTGAPKISAMELVDEHETFSRGLYSGSVGYFTPDLDFDFNVVIRSILYNAETQHLTFPTGSAITINSNPEKEFEECLLKAEAMRKVIVNHAG